MVIQRWQSVLLLIAAALMACFTFIPLGQITTTDFTFYLKTLGIFQDGLPTDNVAPIEIKTWYLFMMSLTTLVLIVIDIFLFKNLGFQRKVCLICILFVIADATVAGFTGFCGIEGGSIWWSSNALTPFISILALAMAYWRMTSDSNKLRAADRIR